jgi:hypothetical protein
LENGGIVSNLEDYYWTCGACGNTNKAHYAHMCHVTENVTIPPGYKFHAQNSLGVTWVKSEVNVLPPQREKCEAVIDIDIENEYDTAAARFPPFNSAHEGFAVLKEEVDELWDEVKAKQGARDIAKMRREAIQVAAMALRFIIDVCDTDKGQK